MSDRRRYVLDAAEAALQDAGAANDHLADHLDRVPADRRIPLDDPPTPAAGDLGGPASNAAAGITAP